MSGAAAGAWDCQGLFSLAFILALILCILAPLIPSEKVWSSFLLLLRRVMRTALPMRVWRMHNDFVKHGRC